MNTKQLNYFLLLVIIGGISVSCAMNKAHKSTVPYENSKYESTDETDRNSAEISRKILYSAALTLSVPQTDTTFKDILNLAKKYDGYVSNTLTNMATIRVKSVHFERAIDEISSMGKVINKSITGRDVTDEYFDYEIRLQNAQKSRERYLELLNMVNSVEAALKIERELERLNEVIDLLKGKMNRINHLDDYSTIMVTLKEKKNPGLLGYVGLGLYYSVKWLFVRN